MTFRMNVLPSMCLFESEDEGNTSVRNAEHLSTTMYVVTCRQTLLLVPTVLWTVDLACISPFIYAFLTTSACTAYFYTEHKFASALQKQILSVMKVLLSFKQWSAVNLHSLGRVL